MTTEVIFPVYNESDTLSEQINIFNKFFDEEIKKNIFITIADNGSTDNTATISDKLLKKKLIQKYVFIPQKGRGRAIKDCIKKSKADIVCYMDIDLSTDLAHFKELIDSISKKGNDISIGSRLSKKSKVVGRKKIREFTSRAYNLLIKFSFNFEEGLKLRKKETTLSNKLKREVTKQKAVEFDKIITSDIVRNIVSSKTNIPISDIKGSSLPDLQSVEKSLISQ